MDEGRIGIFRCPLGCVSPEKGLRGIVSVPRVASGALVRMENWLFTTRSGRVAHDGGDVFLSIDPLESDRVERSWARHGRQGVGESQSNSTRLVPTIQTVRVANP